MQGSLLGDPAEERHGLVELGIQACEDVSFRDEVDVAEVVGSGFASSLARPFMCAPTPPYTCSAMSNVPA